jgi:phosphate transport system substrate-binding protein
MSNPLRLRAVLSVFICGLSLALPAAAADTIRIGGTGSGTGGMRLLAEAFMRAEPGTDVAVLPAVGSTGGINAVMAGKLEVAVSNRVPTAKEISEAAPLALPTVKYARTPFVMVVHKDLGVTQLNAAQLAAVYADGPATYPNGKRARPVLRLTDSGDTAVLKSFAPEVAMAVDLAATRRGMLNANTDSESADMATSVPGAIAMSTLAQIESERRPLVALTIDNKLPSLANLESGSYPYFKTLYLVTRADASPATRRFAEFVGSVAARKLLEANGHLTR